MAASIYPYLMRFTRASCTNRKGGGRREREREREKGNEAREGREGKESEL